MFSIGGEQSACGVTVAGKAFCWGRYGSRAGFYPDANFPAPIEGNLVFASVSDGGLSTCGLTLDGTAYCWGTNDFGQLGTGTVSAAVNRTPQLVAGGHKFSQIAHLGDYTIALTKAGKLYAWGANSQGYLGDGTRIDRSSPVPIASAQSFLTFSAKSGVAVALTTDGEAWSWGAGWSGSEGVGASATPTPLAAASALRFASAAVSSYNMLLLTSTGEAYGLGVNAYNGFGYYSQLTRVAPSLLFTQVATHFQTHMGLTAEGRLYAWGSNQRGQVGDGTITASATPVAIGGAVRFRQIAAEVSFSAALSTTGEVYFWGRNDHGVFGNGAVTQPDAPSITTPAGPRSRSLSLTVTPGSPTLNAGETLDLAVTVTRIGGGFTTSGVNIGAPGAVTISVQDLPSGVTASYPNSATIGVESPGTILRLKASSSLTGGVGNFGIRAQASNMPTQPSQPISVLKVSSSGGTGLNLECASGATGGSVPSSFPAGYHCMRNSGGNVVVGKFAIPTLTSSAWWVDETAGVCVSWRSDGGLGRSTARFKGGLGGGTTVTQGHWGLLVGRAGLLEGVPGARYLFTSNLDAQTQLLTFNDLSSNTVINNYNFRASATCPW